MTKREIWGKIVDLLTWKQYNRVFYMRPCVATYDQKFSDTLRVTKSKEIIKLCKQGLEAPLTNEVSNERED